MSPPDEDREALIEAAASAHREKDHQGVRSHPAWHDLDDEGRERAFEVATQSRTMEAALDPDGLSTTARAVLARIRTLR